MLLPGPAFLALWNDVEPARTAEYDEWHTFEHVPERVDLAGFRAARRYAAAEREADRYFTLYDLDGLAALDDPAYADVVAHPTPWSRSMRPALRNFVRMPCARCFSVGRGEGGTMMTIRLRTGSADALALEQELAGEAGRAGIVAVHLGRAAEAAALPWAATGPGDAAPRDSHVLLVEGLDRSALDAAAARIVDAARRHGFGIGARATYDLAFAVARAKAAPGDGTGTRAPPREDLRRRWQPG